MSAMNQKINEVGWFYHAPARKSESQEPVGVPPTSQIPGLGETEVLEQEEPREMVFRDTDTKYIRMAKMGGRKDLLRIRPNPQTKKGPVSYPRNDWFYLEDNELEDKAQREKEEVDWQFTLPEYMVHQSHGASVEGQPGESVPGRRAPYATDDQSQFSRDGHSMTDKTVRIPETRRPGYGVRSGKPAPRGPMAKLEKAKPQSSQVQGDRPRLRHQPLPSEPEAPTNMNKLLSNTYEREWHERVNKWQDKQRQHQDKTQVFTGKDRPVCSEYGNSFAVSSQKSQRRVSSGTSKGSAQVKEEEKKKEPFKMTKFKNVPARISTHQSPEILAAVGN
ncbi:uncharacterized protein C7orf57 homolog [Babylonia areolata]|uniref:uncharacterized protein C7orf57 homolog n=1 Tax=Babylonia areolata TaxID=304850 RepID=UPI003FD0A400